jgi:hypothetical protein
MRALNHIPTLFLIGLCSLIKQQVQAQCLPLRAINQCLVTGRIDADSIASLLSPNEWEIHRESTIYWTPRILGEAGKTNQRPQAKIELRRTNGQAFYDLLYKTTHHACITQLRNELRRNVSLRTEMVNCLKCNAERLNGYNLSVTIFNQKSRYDAKQTEFPYVLVMRRMVLIQEPEEVAPEDLSQSKDPR